ncbi:hypothetical protein ANN_15628 [Periplaneta americana]|uniref:Uncharacterized protein n=1 Tax=Periplaneta americana TaxID=6978 RepID=A0ABQ8SHL0_PERAM|nr:hypothetical protein ANN_15628 [Periplaneta americana]
MTMTMMSDGDDDDDSDNMGVALYGVETWTLRLSEEKRIEVFEIWIWRRMERVKWTDIIRNEAVLDRVDEGRIMLKLIRKRKKNWLGHVARMGESKNAYRVLVGKPKGRRPLGRGRRSWENNIKMDLRKVGCDDRDWINLAYVKTAMNLRDLLELEPLAVFPGAPASCFAMTKANRPPPPPLLQGRETSVQGVSVPSLTLLGRKFQSRGTATVKKMNMRMFGGREWIILRSAVIVCLNYGGWINFENETQDRQEWRNAICEREGKDSGFSYDSLDGARTTFQGMVLRDHPGEYCRRNGRTYYEHVVVSAPK